MNFWVESDSDIPTAPSSDFSPVFSGNTVNERVKIYLTEVSPMEASMMFKNDEDMEKLIYEYDTLVKITRAKQFEMREFRMKGDSQFLIIKVAGRPKGMAYLEFSGSQVSPLQINKIMHGAVKNDPDKYKVYKLIFDSATLTEPDLMVEIESCKGRVDVFVSEDFESIWDAENSWSSVAGQMGKEVHGKVQYRVSDLDLKN